MFHRITNNLQAHLPQGGRIRVPTSKCRLQMLTHSQRAQHGKRKFTVKKASDHVLIWVITAESPVGSHVGGMCCDGNGALSLCLSPCHNSSTNFQQTP